jgi:hypothetical protein
MKAEIKHQNSLKKLKGEKKLKVAFLFINVDIWKYDTLYCEFSNNDRFEPIVVVCPFISEGDDFLKLELKRSVQYCQEKGYDYFIAYRNNQAIDIKKEMDIDIVFFSNPNKHTSKEFLIDNFKNKLSCYISYSFRVSNYYKYEYDVDLLNLVWITFCETEIHKKLSEKYAKNSGKNVVVTGYPHLENFDKQRSKRTEKFSQRKRIIWAPHWTIKSFQNTGHDWACFLDYSDFFLEISDLYSDKIEFIMKPHPFLKKILTDKVWGKTKTDNYFKKWDKNENRRIVEGDYVNLFLESDALIHDSGGFMVEYLIVNKPVAYTANCDNFIERFNPFGKIALNCHTIVTCEKNLRNFIENVIQNEDPLRSKREDVLNRYLNLSDRKPSKNIINEILRRINA